MAKVYPQICWPNEVQQNLLKAALLDGKAALSAYTEWKNAIDVESIDRGSLRILPLLYKKLTALGVQDDLTEKLKGYYRYSWYANQKLIHKASKVLEILEEKGIPTMLIKGPAQLALTYADYGLRPMGDFDFLVPSEKGEEAYQCIKNLGWKPRNRIEDVSKGLGFNDQHGLGIDLHWHVMPECSFKAADEIFWQEAIPIQFHGVSTTVISPHDLIFQSCVYATRYDRNIARIRYFSDIVCALKTLPEGLDNDRISFLAQEFHLILPVSEVLRYIQDTFAVSIGSDLLKLPLGNALTKFEIIEHQVRTRPARPEILEGLRGHWMQYIRKHRIQGFNLLSPKFIVYMEFLKEKWSLASLWYVPFYAINKFKLRRKKLKQRATPS